MTIFSNILTKAWPFRMPWAKKYLKHSRGYWSFLWFCVYHFQVCSFLFHFVIDFGKHKYMNYFSSFFYILFSLVALKNFFFTKNIFKNIVPHFFSYKYSMLIFFPTLGYLKNVDFFLIWITYNTSTDNFSLLNEIKCLTLSAPCWNFELLFGFRLNL